VHNSEVRWCCLMKAGGPQHTDASSATGGTPSDYTESLSGEGGCSGDVVQQQERIDQWYVVGLAG